MLLIFQHQVHLDPTEVSVYQISGVNPTYYLLKKDKKSYISYSINTETFTFTNAIKFDTKNN